MEVRDLVDGAAHGQVSRDTLPALCAGLYRTRVYVSWVLELWTFEIKEWESAKRLLMIGRQ